MQFRGMPGVGRSLALPAGLVALGLAGGAGWWASGHERWVGIAAVSAGLFGLVQLVRAIRALVARRRQADDWLRSATGRVIPPAYAWRAAQLVSQRERCVLARSLRRILVTARERPRGSYAPLLIAVRHRRAPTRVLAPLLGGGPQCEHRTRCERHSSSVVRCCGEKPQTRSNGWHGWLPPKAS